MKTRQQVGRYGEDKACAYLKRKRFQILCRNFRIRYGEIDIVAKDGEELVFVEVKTRTDRQFGKPSVAVDSFKQRRLIQTAQHYIHQNQCYDMPARFDVVEVFIEQNKLFGGTKINHIVNAFALN